MPTTSTSRLVASSASSPSGRPRNEYSPRLSTWSTNLPAPATSTTASMASRSLMTLELLPEAERSCAFTGSCVDPSRILLLLQTKQNPYRSSPRVALSQLKRSRKTAQEELEHIRNRTTLIERLEQDRDALLRHYSQIAAST